MKNISLSSFFRDFFVTEFECTLSFAIIGTLFAKNATVSYAYFFIPLFLGLICMIPCIPIYIKEDMTIPQVIVQRSVELIVLEIVCVWSAWLLAGNFLGISGLVAVAISTASFDALSYCIMYKMEKAETERLNRKLKEFAEKTASKKQEVPEIAKMPVKTNPEIEAFGERGIQKQLSLAEILYFEADGELVFAYTKEEIFQIKLRLYQVEEIAKSTEIIRVSKSHLINMKKIESVRPALNSRLYVKMPNGEEVLVSRKYAHVLKDAMAA